MSDKNSGNKFLDLSDGQYGGSPKAKSPKKSLLETSKCSRDIHSLFLSFNKRFFWNHLSNVDVQWSNRMTSCAGICSYRRRAKYCCIRLSAPLLKLRPHSDLVDTLLHEMIHAYLFLTNKDKSRDGHGPKFHQHKDRINKEAGTNITVFHSFHSEVKLYKQHWWRCNGPCQNEYPYFGMVKRSMNRAPGPNDRWWLNHLFRCGGTYTKIREPIEYARKNKNNNVEDSNPGQKYALENIVGYVDLTSLGTPNATTLNNTQKRGKNQLVAEIVDLTAEPQEKKVKSNDETCKCPSCDKECPRELVSEHLESCEGLLDIFDIDFEDLNDWIDEDINDSEDDKSTKQSCPICSSQIEGDLKSHVEDCLNNSGIVNILDEDQKFISDENDSTDNKTETSVKDCCPICGIHIKNNFKVHVDSCLNESFNVADLVLPNNGSNFIEKDRPIDSKASKASVLNYKYNKEDSLKCPICNKSVKSRLEDHVNHCLNQTVSSCDFDDQVIDLSNLETPKKKLEISKSTLNNNNSEPCPVCGKLFEKDLKIHLKKCMNEPCIIVDFEKPIVVISDDDSPVKVLGSKVPLPKVELVSNCEDSESRITCRVCGMRFGISKFNSHVCYPTVY